MYEGLLRAHQYEENALAEPGAFNRTKVPGAFISAVQARAASAERKKHLTKKSFVNKVKAQAPHHKGENASAYIP